MAKLVMCVSSSHVSDAVMVERGRLYYADDPVVKQNPGMFTENLESFAVPYDGMPIIETATAAPGEIRRGPGRPRKDSYV